MTNRFVLFALFLTLPALVSTQAMAQRCVTDPALIIKMKKPAIGSYNVWDRVYGEPDRTETFSSILSLPEFKTMVAGEVTQDNETDMKLLLLQLDHRGRTDWEKIHTVNGLDKVVKILPHPTGYLVVANQQKSKENPNIWIGLFNKSGALKSEKSIDVPHANIQAHDITAMPDGKGFLLSSTIKNKKGITTPHARIYHLDNTASPVGHKAFVTGTQNALLGITPAGDNTYIATGYATGNDGRQNGWAVKFDDNNAILWQRQYPRGHGSRIKAARPFQKGYIVATGTAQPINTAINNDLSAAWVLMLGTTNGEPLWQRYYIGDIGYSGQDILTKEDGAISVLLSGQNNPDTGETAFSRILTINPRGFLLTNDEYFNGEGAEGHQMIFGPRKERIIVGQTIIPHRIKNPDKTQKEETIIKNSIDGWVVVGAKARDYTDPCKPPSRNQDDTP